MFMCSVIKLDKKNITPSIRFSAEDYTQSRNSSKENSTEVELHNRYKTGYSDGQNEMRQTLESAFNKEICDTKSQVGEFLTDLNEKIVEFEEQFVKLTLETSFIIAEKLLRKEIEKDSNINSLIEESLKKIITANEIIVKVNPADYELAVQNKQAYESQNVSAKIRFEKNERIEKGSCLIESEAGNVDARFSSQINELKRKLDTIVTN